MDLSDVPLSALPRPGFPMVAPRRDNTKADFWTALFSHRPYFDDIGKGFTRGDIRLSFFESRAMRGKWLEQKALKNEADLKAMGGEFDGHTIDFQDPNAQSQAEELFERIDRDLSRYSQAYQQDRATELAPRASPHYLDTVVRYNILQPERGLKCPNGEALDFFGKVGDPPRPDFIAICETEQSFFSRVIVGMPMRYYFSFLYNPARKMLKRVLGRPLPSTDEDQIQAMSQRTHDVLVGGLETMLACAYVAGSIALSVNIPSQTNRLIAMTIMSLLFPFTVLFLSREGRQMFLLCAAFWAVTVTLIPRGSLSH